MRCNPVVISSILGAHKSVIVDVKKTSAQGARRRQPGVIGDTVVHGRCLQAMKGLYMTLERQYYLLGSLDCGTILKQSAGSKQRAWCRPGSLCIWIGQREVMQYYAVNGASKQILSSLSHEQQISFSALTRRNKSPGLLHYVAYHSGGKVFLLSDATLRCGVGHVRLRLDSEGSAHCSSSSLLQRTARFLF